MTNTPIEEVTGPVTAGEDDDEESERDGLAKDEVTPEPGEPEPDAGTGWGAAVAASAQAKDGEEVIFKVEGRQLGIPLTEEEFHSIAKSLAETHETIDAVELEKTEITARLGGRLKTLYAEASSRAKSLRKGERVDWVDVEIVHVPSQNRKFVRRKDTGEIVEGSEEAMTGADRQLAIDFPNGMPPSEAIAKYDDGVDHGDSDFDPTVPDGEDVAADLGTAEDEIAETREENAASAASEEAEQARESIPAAEILAAGRAAKKGTTGAKKKKPAKKSKKKR